METAEMREAIALGRKHNVKFEASGGVNLRTVRRVAATGVDYHFSWRPYSLTARY